jgi:hypothetical protein
MAPDLGVSDWQDMTLNTTSGNYAFDFTEGVSGEILSTQAEFRIVNGRYESYKSGPFQKTELLCNNDSLTIGFPAFPVQ